MRFSEIKAKIQKLQKQLQKQLKKLWTTKTQSPRDFAKAYFLLQGLVLGDDNTIERDGQKIAELGDVTYSRNTLTMTVKPTKSIEFIPITFEVKR